MNTVIETAGKVGRSTLDVVRETGGVGMLLAETIYWGFIAPIRGVLGFVSVSIPAIRRIPTLGEFIPERDYKGYFPDRDSFSRQCFIEGIESIPIVALLTGTVGLILGMNTAYYLDKLGAANLMPLLVSFAMVRELGPLIASIIISGRVGASIAAEIGTMVVSEEIDALKSMALSPVRFLVVPRVAALFLMLPCLGLLGTATGIFGSFSYATMKLHMGFLEFKRLAFESLEPDDVWTGVLKTFVFALLIGGIACFKGLTVHGGAEGVGRATTETVVHSIFAIILFDGLFTIIFTVFFP